MEKNPNQYFLKEEKGSLLLNYKEYGGNPKAHTHIYKDPRALQTTAIWPTTATCFPGYIYKLAPPRLLAIRLPPNIPTPLLHPLRLTGMAHLQLSAVAGARPAAAGGRGDEMEDVALLDSYDEEMGLPLPGASGAEAAEGAAEAHVRVTGMTCSACTSAVEAAVSARRGVRRVAVSLLQNRAHVMFDPALAKVLIGAPLLALVWRISTGDAILAYSQPLSGREARAVPWEVGSSPVRLRGGIFVLNCLRFFRVTCSCLTMVGLRLRFCVSEYETESRVCRALASCYRVNCIWAFFFA